MDRDTVTDMGVDLARCWDTLEQDLVILYYVLLLHIHMSPLFIIIIEQTMFGTPCRFRSFNKHRHTN